MVRQFNVFITIDDRIAPFIEEAVNGDMVIYLSEIPSSRKANLELTALIARHHAIDPAAVAIVRGTSSRRRVIRLTS